MPSPRILPIATVKTLLAHAERAGAPADWLRAAADELLRALLELQELRSHGRRDGTFQKARRAAALRRSGVAAAVIAERLGVGRATAYRLLALSRRVSL
jgi:hypothetical protein